MKWSRLTVNLDPKTADLAKGQAKKQRRSFAAYVATLIEQDISRTAAEDQAPYGQADQALTVKDMIDGENKRRAQQDQAAGGAGHTAFAKPGTARGKKR